MANQHPSASAASVDAGKNDPSDAADGAIAKASPVIQAVAKMHDTPIGHGTANGNGHADPQVGSAAHHPNPAEGKSSNPNGQSGVRHPAPTGEASDEQLLDAYRNGDRASFPKLVDRYQRELFHFLVRFLGDRAAAEDVFQETFLQVHQSADTFDTQRRFRPWLFTIAANKGRDLIRSQSRRPTNRLQASISPGDDESGEFIDLMQSAQAMPGNSLEREEIQQLVQRTVLAMPDHLREILLLSYFHQFPYKQISDILGIPLGTVKSRLHAAVAYFAERWHGTNQNNFLS